MNRALIVISTLVLSTSSLIADEALSVMDPLERAANNLAEDGYEPSIAESRVEDKFMVAYGGFKNNMVKPRASKVHDRVTFVVEEKTSSAISADTELNSEMESIFHLKNWFELDRNDEGQPTIKPYSMYTDSGEINTQYNSDDYSQINLKSTYEHEGEGETNRSNTFTTRLSGVVIEVLPNKNLVVEAKKTVRVNNETQSVTLIGIVDPNDLNENSEVKSDQIIDLDIRYTGEGDVSNTIREGWLTRLTNKFKAF